MCGVFGIRAPERDVARVTFFGLFALQHRGQESAGIAVSDEGRLTVLRDMGLVTQVFDEQKLRGLHGDTAIGHTRYSTTGSTHWANAQPLIQRGHGRTVALGHNGNLVNATELREQGVKLKFNPLAEVAGKRVVAVDDSIVRGNTTRKIVELLFEAGAAEVHVRVSAPPVVGQCFYGIDLAAEDEMIASTRTVEQIREHIGATSLAYLSLEGLEASTTRPPNELCRACLTRDYPTAVPREGAKLRYEPARV